MNPPLIDALRRAAALVIEQPEPADHHSLIHVLHWALTKASDSVEQNVQMGDALGLAHGGAGHIEHHHETDTLADWAMFFLFVADALGTGDFIETEEEQSARLAKEAIGAIMQMAQAAQQGQGDAWVDDMQKKMSDGPTLH